jgi:hypothetical protein
MKKERVVKQLLTWLLILILAAPPAAMGQDAGVLQKTPSRKNNWRKFWLRLRFIPTICFPRY